MIRPHLSFTLFFGLLLLSACTSSKQPQFDPDFDIYLCLGQSNMVGQDKPAPEDSIVPSRLFFLPASDDLGWGDEQWKNAVPPLCSAKGGLTPADYFGRTMLDYVPEEKKIGLIVVAINGTGITLFDRDHYQAYIDTIPERWMLREINNFGGNPYQRLITAARQAQQRGVIRGILLHQGETDAISDQWATDVKKIYHDILQDLGLQADSVPLLAGEAVGRDQDGTYQHVNVTIDRLPEFIPTAHVISSQGCKPLDDHLHFSTAGQRRLGRRYAIKMLQMMGQDIANDDNDELQTALSDEDNSSFWVNAHVRRSDSLLIITSPHTIQSIDIFSFSGRQLYSSTYNALQMVEISLAQLAEERHLAITVHSSDQQTVTTQVDL